MFRPLLSNVPTSTLYAGKASTAHHSVTSRTSSITTSNNTSSDQVTTGVHDTKGSEQNLQDTTRECVEGQYSEVQDKIFELDRSDALNEDVELNTRDKSPNNQDDKFDGHSVVVVTESCSHIDTATGTAAASIVPETRGDCSDAVSLEDTMVCSKCGHTFHSAELVMEGDLQLCLGCRNLELTSTRTTTLVSMAVSENTSGDFVQILEHGPAEALDCSTANSESWQVTSTGKAGTKQLHRSYSEPTQNLNFSPSCSVSPLMVGEGELTITNRQVTDQSIDDNSSYQHVGGYPSSNVDVSEGAGTALLLKRSSRSQGHVQSRSRSFTTSNISYDDFSCIGDSINSTRSSIGHGSASMTSSVDFGSLRQIETRVQRQVNYRKSDLENYRFEILTKHKRSLSSLSGASSHGFQVLSVATSSQDDSFEIIASNVEKDAREAACTHLRQQSLTSECTEAGNTCTDNESNNNFRTALEMSGNAMNIHIADTSVVSVLNIEERASHESGDYLTNNSSNSMTTEASSTLPQNCTLGEDATPNSCDRVDVEEVPNPSSLDAISEVGVENGDIFSPDSQSDTDSTNSKSGMNDSMQPSVSKGPNDDTIASVEEPDNSDPGQSALGMYILHL